MRVVTSRMAQDGRSRVPARARTSPSEATLPKEEKHPLRKATYHLQKLQHIVAPHQQHHLPINQNTRTSILRPAIITARTRIAFDTRTETSPTCTMSDIKATETPAPREKLEAQIKSADMTEDMQQESIEVAQEAMAKFTIEKDIAQHIKRTFDERKGPTWHCIVGRNFGSFVTHETKHFIYFYLGHCAILLFKTQ
ncbi:hypothetical protein CDV31_002229 [Fusarium ambrosium]|nr:hypothetical protein CDV31_002229 [Fusarium ambrosium]